MILLVGLYLLEKEMFLISVDLVMLDDKKEYFVEKCLEYFEKCFYGSKSREKWGIFCKENFLFVDLERMMFFSELIIGELFLFVLKMYKEKGDKCYMEFILSKEVLKYLREKD